MRLRFALCGLGVALLTAGGAGGYALGKDVPIRTGDTAVFGPTWRCYHGQPRRADVTCSVGDQTPEVQLLGGRRLLTVKVLASVPETRVRTARKHECAEPGRCYYVDTYTFSGGAGG